MTANVADFDRQETIAHQIGIQVEKVRDASGTIQGLARELRSHLAATKDTT